ncbi:MULTISPECIES: heme o synthase [Paenibacillus]|jgi:protoheme IX farnesyltransferase|uniref:Protoheme IX farnesyltransferase n=1 Tax=Paenibacillus agaridevorans TaxID=171404 RepID=A0A2R5ENU3_9BACL|nr:MULTISPECIES: heme o synthase [Paenibacillus]QNK55788.1 protoheme IX farnesyltransferase [Paenibacillus sp. PAMC21692]GBG08332.1 protoheme IX farnesyltransferase [Paenibacillus agaridevorans]
MRVQGNTVSVEPIPTSVTKVLFETIKIGIIKSNLIAMVAGLTMALFVHDIPFMDRIGNIALALIGSALVIGAAGIFNNLYDRDIDSIMDRTKNRPTVSGIIDTWSGLIMGGWIALGGLVALYIASPLSALMGFLGLFLYVVPYTMWTKRRTIYNTEVGSLSGAMPPLIGWAAISPDIFHPGAIALFVLMVIWQMPHFYAIGIRRMEEYRAANIPMLPVVKGIKRTYVQMNVYLVALFMSSFLFWSFNPYIAIANALLSLGWLILSINGYRRKQEDKWARSMFIFSLNHITVLLLLIVGYSVGAPLL